MSVDARDDRRLRRRDSARDVAVLGERVERAGGHAVTSAATTAAAPGTDDRDLRERRRDVAELHVLARR